MVKKYEQDVLGGYADLKNDFQDDDYILTYRPEIKYIAPEGIEDEAIEEGVVPPTVDEIRNRTEKVIESYRAIKDLAEIAQDRIDGKVTAAGGLDIHLDPVRDAYTIAALQRKFPDADPSVITYDQYRDCLDAMRRSQLEKGKSILPVDADYQLARSDPYRVNFGGLGSLPGMNRPEIASPAAQIVEPIDIDQFQGNVITALFQKMIPKITELVFKLINPFG